MSCKNRAYCELTGQYWAWKNVQAAYYGFFHYRRYLYPDERAKWPYRIENRPTAALLDELGYSGFEAIICKHDIILPKKEDMHISVREHYAGANGHFRKDLETVERIVRERHPEMEQAMERYLSGTQCYFGNIYIMRREVFRDYCSWLFPILAEFDARTDMSHYTAQERRADGYLAERLLGIYATHWQENLRLAELPRVCFEPALCRRTVWRIENAVLPPGTRRRAAVKKLVVRAGQ